MAYIVTARKWRPDRFEDVVGQEHITTTLKNAIKNNRIAHAYIFAGPRGVGKTTTARILSKTLNCLHPVDFEPCNNCEMCLTFNTNQSLDIIEIDGASSRRIEDIRALRESVKYAPTKGTYKVYIIDEVHMLTNESFNALLKTLEEPPEHTIFIFATTDIHKVPLTIISRCQRFDFRRIELSSIKKLLRKIADAEKISIDDQSLTIIAKKADGALRDAESIFDQIVSFSDSKVEGSIVSQMLNLIDDEIYFSVSDAVLSKNFAAAFEITHKIYENGWNFLDFYNGLIEHFRNIMAVVVTGKTSLIETADVYKEKYLLYRAQFSESDILRLLNFLNKSQQELKSVSNQRLKTEVSLSLIIGLEKSASIREILNNLEDIKKKSLSQETTNSIGPVNDSPIYVTNIKPVNTVISETPIMSVSAPLSRTASVNSDSFDFRDITDKWSILLSEVNQEKFIVGGALSHLKPLNLDGTKLFLESNDPSAIGLIEQNKDFFKVMTEKVFGKHISFNFADQSNVHALSLNDDYSNTEVKTETTSRSKADDEVNPLIKAIMVELGGDELV